MLANFHCSQFQNSLLLLRKVFPGQNNHLQTRQKANTLRTFTRTSRKNPQPGSKNGSRYITRRPVQGSLSDQTEFWRYQSVPSHLPMGGILGHSLQSAGNGTHFLGLTPQAYIRLPVGQLNSKGGLTHHKHLSPAWLAGYTLDAGRSRIKTHSVERGSRLPRVTSSKSMVCGLKPAVLRRARSLCDVASPNRPMCGLKQGQSFHFIGFEGITSSKPTVR